MGLRDPKIESEALEEKLWQKWMINKDALWNRIWNLKYSHEMEDINLIILTSSKISSLTWNIGWKYNSLLQNPCFQKVRDVQLALFKFKT